MKNSYSKAKMDSERNIQLRQHQFISATQFVSKLIMVSEPVQFIQICEKFLRLLAIISYHKNCQLMKWKIKNSNGLIVIFLTEKNYVCVDRSISSSEPVYCGVPQISILGPLLLIIFINGLSDYVEHASVIMYAANTVLYVSHETKDKIENNLN